MADSKAVLECHDCGVVVASTDVPEDGRVVFRRIDDCGCPKHSRFVAPMFPQDGPQIAVSYTIILTQ